VWINPEYDAIPLGDASVANAVETDGIDLVEIGESREFRRQIADTSDWGDIASRRVNRLKGSGLGAARICQSQQCLVMVHTQKRHPRCNQVLTGGDG